MDRKGGIYEKNVVFIHCVIIAFLIMVLGIEIKKKIHGRLPQRYTYLKLNLGKENIMKLGNIKEPS